MSQEDLKNKIREIIKEIAEIDEVPDTTPFSELGIDSMMALEVVSDVEREFGVSVPEEELPGLTDLEKVFALVHDKLEKGAAA